MMIDTIKLSTSAVALILNNLVPLFGVIFLSWNFSNIIFLYWFENIVIGIFTVMKMKMTQHPVAYKLSEQKNLNLITAVMKLFIIGFFIIHFGAFTLGHGVFLLVIFGRNINFKINLLIAILAMFISHGISFIENYVQPKKYLSTHESILMFAPYPRIIVMHLVVGIGAFFVADKMSLIPMVLFVILKTVVDLGSHLFEHAPNNPQKSNHFLEKVLRVTLKNSLQNGRWDQVVVKIDPKDK